MSLVLLGGLIYKNWWVVVFVIVMLNLVFGPSYVLVNGYLKNLVLKNVSFRRNLKNI
jgi:hypothetical protein